MGENTKKIVTNSYEETVKEGEKFGKTLKKGDVVAFRGGLGTGKTAFITGVVSGVGLKKAEVSSPTFAILNEYIGEDINIYHFDMYRISGERSLESTGFFDCDFKDGIALIEWSENIENFLPKGTISVTMNMTGENEREITITGGENNADSGN